jgi:hypothetical protein
MVKIRNAYRILVGKHDGKRPLGRPGRKGGENIEMVLGKIGWEIVDCKSARRRESRGRCTPIDLQTVAILKEDHLKDES